VERTLGQFAQLLQPVLKELELLARLLVGRAEEEEVRVARPVLRLVEDGPAVVPKERLVANVRQGDDVGQEDGRSRERLAAALATADAGEAVSRVEGRCLLWAGWLYANQLPDGGALLWA